MKWMNEMNEWMYEWRVTWSMKKMFWSDLTVEKYNEWNEWMKWMNEKNEWMNE